MVLVLALMLATVTAAPADVKGKWDGKLTAQRDDGSASEDTVLLILDQKDATVTGTIGGSESDQHPITSGTIEGDKVTILAKNANNDREYRLELTLENDELKGTVVSGTRKAQVVAKKRKE
jgi:predicted dehydrogenase